jgi:hypothetical protein
MEAGIQFDTTRAPAARTTVAHWQLARTEEPTRGLSTESEQIRTFFRRHEVSVPRS